MNPLSYLLQAVGIQHPAAQTPDGGDITVTARPPQMTNSQDAQPIPVGNRAQLQDIMDAQANAPVHKGLFGQKGTLRDVLGAVGDAFLMQAGHNPVYHDRRDQEKTQDALVGFTQNPQAAFERVAAVNPDLAGKLYDQYQTNQARMASAQALGQYRGAQTQVDKNKVQHYARGYAAAMLNAAGGDPDKQAYALDQIKGFAGQIGMDPTDIGIHDNMSPEEMATYARGGMTTKEQYQSDVARQNANSRQTAVGIQGRNANTNAARAAETRDYHNKMVPIYQQNANSGSGRAAAAQQNADTGSYNADIRNNKAVADGAPPAHRPAPTRPAPAQPNQGPKEGERRVINGATYEWRGGKAVRVGGSDIPLAQ